MFFMASCFGFKIKGCLSATPSFSRLDFNFQPIVIFAFFERVILCPRQFNAGIIQSESKTNAKLFFAKPVSWIVLSTHYLELYSQFEFNTKVFYR